MKTDSTKEELKTKFLKKFPEFLDIENYVQITDAWIDDFVNWVWEEIEKAEKRGRVGELKRLLLLSGEFVPQRGLEDEGIEDNIRVPETSLRDIIKLRLSEFTSDNENNE